MLSPKFVDTEQYIRKGDSKIDFNNGRCTLFVNLIREMKIICTIQRMIHKESGLLSRQPHLSFFLMQLHRSNGVYINLLSRAEFNGSI